MHNVFISYSHAERSVATTVLSLLESKGIKCWIDYRDAVPGENYAGSIVQAIKHCDVVVLLLSERSGNSIHVLNEINSAVNAARTIIPFKLDDYELSDNLEYYLGKTHWLEALTPPLEAHIEHLAETLLALIKGEKAPLAKSRIVKEPEHSPKARTYRMVKFADLLEIGYTATSIALQLVENDYVNCNGITEDNEGSAEQWEEYLQNDSDTFQYLLDADNHIVGDWSIVALSEDAMALAKKGELLEKNIGLDNTEMICFPDDYYGYILTFSILPAHRNANNFNLIVSSWLAQLEEYAKNGIFFREWCINVFGKEVEALVRRLGFSYVCNNVSVGKIYTCTSEKLLSIALVKQFPTLISLYKEHYDD